MWNMSLNKIWQVVKMCDFAHLASIKYTYVTIFMQILKTLIKCCLVKSLNKIFANSVDCMWTNLEANS